MQADKILKLVRLTEKSNKLSSELGQYTFEVYGHANKHQIAEAVVIHQGKSRAEAIPEAKRVLERVTAEPPETVEISVGVYVAMNGRWFAWDDVRKNRDLGVFESIKGS